MFDRDDLLKKLQMIWDKNKDIAIRGNLIREYLEKTFKYIGIDSNKYLLMVVDFENKKDVTSDLNGITVIRVNYLNMNGELQPIIDALDSIIKLMSIGPTRFSYEIDDLNKKIKR